VQRLGRYRLLRPLGQGGAADVFAAERDRPHRPPQAVAVKVLRRGADLRREARLGGLLRHRHLVDVYEVGEDQGIAFAALELCPGGALSAHLPLPPRAVVEVGLAVCDALDYAHRELRLVHLDLKPDNLLLAADGTVKVADLGIAQAAGFEAEGRIRGTPGYMAPEQARGEAVDARADVYALGATLLELATGSRSVASGTLDWDTLDEPAPAALDAVPAWLAAVVDRCLAPDPGDRFPSMAALASALRALPADGPGLRDHLGLDPESAAPVSDGNLRAEPDAWVGREAERAALDEALAASGVVALVGPAGIGKSRLAEAAARAWCGPGRLAWWCDVSGARTLDDVVSAVAAVLGVPLGAGSVDAHATQLGHALAGRGAGLLVLDGCDRLGGACAVAARWAALGARVVLTSRTPLPVDATVLRVGPLPPSDALALLVARAAERGADVASDPGLPALAARLDGVPLALELAAGRLGVLSVAEVTERLGLSFLRSGAGGRHGTLRAALDWSWAQLPEAERAALAQLSVFAGDFAPEAALRVVDLGGAPVAPALAALVERSMVSPPHGRDGTRLRLLAGTREYAAEQLGAEAPAAEVRHGRWVAGLREALGPVGSAARLRALAADLDDVLAACRRAVDRGDAAQAVAALDTAWEVLALTGPFAPAVDLAAAVAAVPGAAGGVVERVWGAALQRSGRGAEGLAHSSAAVAAHHAAGDRAAEGVARTELGAALRDLGRADEALAELGAAWGLLREVGDRRAEGVARGELAVALRDRGRTVDALAAFEAALAAHREVGDRSSEGSTLANLANLLHERGRGAEALAHMERARSVFREVGDRRSEGIVLGNLGALHHRRGQRDEAAAWYREALEIHRALGNRRTEGVVLGNAAQLAAPEEALALYEAALAIHQEVGNRRAEADVRANLAVERWRADQPAAAQAEAEGALRVHRAVGNRRGEGTVLDLLGALHRDQGRPAEARAHHEQALALLVAVGDGAGEGLALAHLARLDARDGDRATALARLERAEALLRAAGDEDRLAVVHAARAEVLAGGCGWPERHADARPTK
jgi:predicted ATPase